MEWIFIENVAVRVRICRCVRVATALWLYKFVSAFNKQTIGTRAELIAIRMQEWNAGPYMRLHVDANDDDDDSSSVKIYKYI